MPDPQRAVQRHRHARKHRRRHVPHGAVGGDDRGGTGGVEVDVVVEQGELHERHAHPDGDAGQDGEHAGHGGARGEREPEHADGGEEGGEEDAWETGFGSDLAFAAGLGIDLVPARPEARFQEHKVDEDTEEVTGPGCEKDKTGLLARHAVKRRVDVWKRLRCDHEWHIGKK